MLNLSTTTSVLRMTPGTAGQIASSYDFVDDLLAASAPSFLPGSVQNADLTTTTATAVVPAPALSTTIRNVKRVAIANESATVTTTLLVERYDGTNTSLEIFVTLLPNEHLILDDAGVWWYYAADGTLKNQTLIAVENASTANQTGFAADTILTGSAINMPASFPAVGSRYRCKFDMTKTAAGTATFIATVRYGTAGTTADTAIATFTFTAQTAAIDDGVFEIDLSFRTVGTGTSAVTQAICELRHSLAATGLTTAGTGGSKRLLVTSAGFNSAQAGAIMSVSVNGGTAFVGTNTLVQSQFKV